MLHINQWLDKLAAMRSDFITRGMMPADDTAGGGISEVLTHPLGGDGDTSDDEKGPSEEEEVLGHVYLAQTCHKSSLNERPPSD